MRYKAKSALIARLPRKDQEDLERPCFISLFTENDPHLSGDVPLKRLDFDRIKRILIKGLDIIYLPLGNDILINNLHHIEIEKSEHEVLVTGTQTT